MKWIDFYYEQPLSTKSQAIRNAKTLVANKQPVGVPALPLFNKAQYDLANTWIKPYINVPLSQMKPFTTGIFNQTVIPEPAASTQSVYHSLDAVVEAVLTDKNADVQRCSQQANSTRAARDQRAASSSALYGRLAAGCSGPPPAVTARRRSDGSDERSIEHSRERPMRGAALPRPRRRRSRGSAAAG